MKQIASPQNLVTLSVRVSQQTADRLKDVADAHYRPVAAELRRLIEAHIDREATEHEEAA